MGGVDSVVLRMTLDTGGSGGLKDTVSFTANGAAKSISFTTENDQAFQAQGCEAPFAGKLALMKPDGSPNADGSRFALECRLKLSSLGAVGQSLSGFSIEATQSGSKGDIVPGGYYTVAGTLAPTPSDPDHCAYAKPSYALTGPTRYAGLTAPAQILGTAGEVKTTTLVLKNKLGARSQDLTLSVEAPAGVTVTMKAGDQSGSPLTLTLPALGERNVDMTIQSGASATGTLHMVLTTNLGGRIVQDISMTVNPADSSGPNTTLPTNSQGGGGGQSTPAPSLILGLLGALALARRR